MNRTTDSSTYIRKERQRIYLELRKEYSDKDLKELATSYQNGDSHAGAKLLEIYSLVIDTFFYLIKRNKYNMHNDSVRSLISAFIGTKNKEALISAKKIRRNLRRNNPGNEALRELHEKASLIYYACLDLSDDEVLQELRTIFLVLIYKWKDVVKVPFSGYIRACFKWGVKDWLKRWLHENHKGGFFLEYIDGMTEASVANCGTFKYTTEGQKIPLGILEKNTTLPLTSEVIIDDLWIVGITCEVPYDILTTEERLFIKLKWIDGHTQREIAKILGYHPNTIVKKKKALLVKLREKVAEEDKI